MVPPQGNAITGGLCVGVIDVGTSMRLVSRLIYRMDQGHSPVGTCSVGSGERTHVIVCMQKRCLKRI